MIHVPSAAKDHRDSGPVSATLYDPGVSATFEWRPKPPEDHDPQVGPHNRCTPRFGHTHPTADPAGYVRCQGEPGCPIRLRVDALGRTPTAIELCWWHRDQRWDHDWRTEQLMGAKPEQSTGRIAG